MGKSNGSRVGRELEENVNRIFWGCLLLASKEKGKVAVLLVGWVGK